MIQHMWNFVLDEREDIFQMYDEPWCTWLIFQVLRFLCTYPLLYA